MQVKEKGKIKDVAIYDVTADNYIVPEGEEKFYHCLIEVKQFDRSTGKRLSIPRIQKFGKKFFESVGLHQLRQQNYDVVILHNPREWEEKQKHIEEANRKKREEEAKLKAEKEAENKKKMEEFEREKMRKQIRAEVMEEMKNNK